MEQAQDPAATVTTGATFDLNASTVHMEVPAGGDALVEYQPAAADGQAAPMAVDGIQYTSLPESECHTCWRPCVPCSILLLVLASFHSIRFCS